jgi:hypothetical protein
MGPLYNENTKYDKECELSNHFALCEIERSNKYFRNETLDTNKIIEWACTDDDEIPS